MAFLSLRGSGPLIFSMSQTGQVSSGSRCYRRLKLDACSETLNDQDTQRVKLATLLVCACACVCVHVCMCACVCVCAYSMHVHVCVGIHVCVGMHTCMCVSMCEHVCMFIRLIFCPSIISAQNSSQPSFTSFSKVAFETVPTQVCTHKKVKEKTWKTLWCELRQKFTSRSICSHFLCGDGSCLSS